MESLKKNMSFCQKGYGRFATSETAKHTNVFLVGITRNQMRLDGMIGDAIRSLEWSKRRGDR